MQDHETIEYTKREAIARMILESFGGYIYPMDASLVDEAERVIGRSNPRAVGAVDLADRIIAEMKSKRRTWSKRQRENRHGPQKGQSDE